MKFPNFFLILFIFFTALCFVGIIAENDIIFMVGKTAVFPCLVFYYIDHIKKINPIFLLILLIFYITDLIIVADFINKEQYLEILLNLNHLLILYLTLKNIEKKPINYKILVFTVFMFILGTTIEYLIYDLMKEKYAELGLRIFLSGILISIFNSISLYNYLLRNCYVYYYFGFACLSLALMYCFFNVYRYIFNLQALRLLSLSFKILTYFLFVKYMIAKERRDLKLIHFKQQ